MWVPNTHAIRVGEIDFAERLSNFVVGNDELEVSHSSKLHELKGLNDLRGELRIKNLEKVGADDAAAAALEESKEAILKEKQLLQSLRLDLSDIRKYPESTADNAKAEHTTTELVLAGLEPHPNLKELFISNYPGERFPSWMVKMDNMVKITSTHSDRCQQLQPLDQLRCLKFLDLYYFYSLEYIQKEDYGNNKNNNNQVRDGPPPSSSSSSSTLLFFPSLQELNLWNLPKLKGWWKRRRESVSSSSLVFPQLTKLTIHGCSMFTCMPLHPNLENLKLEYVSEKLVRERLTTTRSTSAEEEERKVDDDYHHHYHQMSSSSNIISSSSSSISSKLKSLHISGIKDLEVLLPEFLRKNLTSLESLTIQSCYELLCLTSSSSEAGEGEGGGGGGGEGFRYLTSLRTLEIRECAKLKSISREVRHLTALEDLYIHDCPELELSDDNDDGIHWQCLRSLRKLEISNIPKLVTLPVGIQHLTTLQQLKIQSCSSFLAVPDWIGNLTQLQQLRFSYCRNLASLPQEIRCLTSLQQLKTKDCPKLWERCHNETGEDWLKIAHIPNIRIDYDMIQGTKLDKFSDSDTNE